MEGLIGPSRARIWTGRGSAVPGPARSRVCPQCPADPFRSCLRWIRENCKGSSSGGRWGRMVGVHPSRQSPASNDPKLVQFLDPERQRCCERTDMHGGHTHGPDPMLWCRGRI